jgi:hypothetical protein
MDHPNLFSEQILELSIFVTLTSAYPAMLCINMCALIGILEIFSVSETQTYKHEVDIFVMD